jgi:hypothetical protein
MKRFATALISCSALFMAQTAMAQVHSNPYLAPAATPAWEIYGTATVTKGITLDCDFVMTLSGAENNPDTGGPGVSHTDMSNVTAEITLSGGTGGLCSAVTIDPIPLVQYTGSGNVGTAVLKNVYAHTITLGDCTGDINVSWNNGTVSFNQTLPPSTGGPACSLVGSGGLATPAGGQILP